MILKGSPKQLVFTPNSDTPYEGANIDLTDGPMVVELPPGPLMCVVNDLNQRYVMDMGLPGPDAGKGGKHVILPPGYKGKVPTGYFAGTPTTNRVLLLVRAIPPAGDVDAAVAMLKTVKLYPLNNPSAASKVTWIDVGDKHIDFTAVPFEKTIGYWNQLAEVINREPAYEGYRMEYGLLASLGIEKGYPFSPDTRMQGILVKAARLRTIRCVCSRLRTGVRIVLRGPIENGSGRRCVRRTELSTPRRTKIWTREKNGSTRRKSNRPQCSGGQPPRARCTGSAYERGAARFSTAARRTS